MRVLEGRKSRIEPDHDLFRKPPGLNRAAFFARSPKKAEQNPRPSSRTGRFYLPLMAGLV